MAYNPTRVSGALNRNPKRRIQNPHAGIKHSQIVGRSGPQSLSLKDYQQREATPFGWNIPTFKGKTFEVIYSYMCSRNNTGTMKHPKLDCSIRVLSGQLYVTMGGEVMQLNAGQSVSIEAGVEYSLATPGTMDTELLFSQGANYDQGLVMVSPPTAANESPAATFVAPQEEVRLPPRRRSETTQKNAEKLAAVQKSRKAERTPMKKEKRQPLAGQTVVGMNPQPVGAGGYGSD